MSANWKESFRTPEAVFVCAVLGLLVLVSISGAVTPVTERPMTLREFMVFNQKQYSQFDEELLIRHFFQDEREGTFVDVGCAWPVRFSTTYYLEHHLGWSGIAIDALAEYREDWEKERPRSRFFQYAVSDTSGGMITFYKGTRTGVSSLTKDNAMRFTNEEPTPIEVPVITLNDLLDREGVESFDFLSMDIEGAEMLALAGFDIERFRPRLICIEGRGSDTERRIPQYFEAHGYVPMEDYKPFDKINYFFARKATPSDE